MKKQINKNWMRPAMYILAGLVLGYLFFGSREKPSQAGSAQSQSTATEEVWTCSMHPQIRQNEPGLCPICEMDLIPAGEQSAGSPVQFTMTPEAKALAAVETQVVGNSPATGTELRLNGTVRADERRISHQVSHIPGRLEYLAVQFTGEQVRAGQKIAAVYSPELVQAQRELLEAAQLADNYPGMLEAARNKLRNWKVSEAQIDEIIRTEKIREVFDIYADRSGFVNKRYLSVGDYLKPGERIFELVDLNQVWVLFDAYEQDLSHIRTGQRIEFTTPSVPGKVFSGRISYIDPQLDADRRVVRLRVEQPNPGHALKPGMYVTGSLFTTKDQAGDRLSVPRSAVLWTGKRSVVWLKVPGTDSPVYEYREVTLGEQTGEQIEVLKGLDAGDEVVTRGAFTLDAAAQLNNQSSMINGLLTEPATPGEQALPSFQMPDKGRAQLAKLLELYLPLKAALAEDDAASASRAAAKMQESLRNFHPEIPDTEARSYADEQFTLIEKALGSFSDAPGIERQRSAFDTLSNALIHLVRTFDIEAEGLYIQHCPMAFDNRGADWISDETAIKNPYFGAKMYKCGTVVGKLNN